jgi:hypothetical protein
MKQRGSSEVFIGERTKLTIPTNERAPDRVVIVPCGSPIDGTKVIRAPSRGSEVEVEERHDASVDV